MTTQIASRGAQTSAQRAGYVCKTCGGPSPVGVGYVSNNFGAFEASQYLAVCECGASVHAEASREEDTHYWTVGDRAHHNIGTDVFPCTVIAVTATTVTVRQDKFKLEDGFDLGFIPGGFHGHCANNYSQKNVIEEDPNGGEMKFHLRHAPKNVRECKYNLIIGKGRGHWSAGGSWRDGMRLLPGWSSFHDFNF